jgi:trimeric autotransporter adhesin
MKRKLIYLISLQLVLSCLSVNAQNWDSLKKGVYGGVRYIYADSSDNSLLVGGNIVKVNGITAYGFAKWDGANWDLSMSNPWGNWEPTICITKYNNEIYNGGGGLKKWSGTNWLSIYTNQPSIVVSLEIINNELYVGGGFDTINGIAAKNLAKWDGITWSSLDFPYANSSIYSIAYYKGELYVGGQFYNPVNPNDSTQNILRYDGSVWKPVGSGIHGGMDDVNAMIVYNDELYVAGSFTKAHGNTGNYIQKWDGTQWSDVGGGVMGPSGSNGQIWQLRVHSGKLYAVGVFQYAGGVPAKFIAMWDGTNWCGLGSVFNNTISAITFLNDTMYVGGNFLAIDGDSISNIAKWTGGNYIDTCGNMTGVNEVVNEENNINTFPNPSDGAFTISYGTLQPSIYIYNSLGKLIYKKDKAAQGSEQINLSAYSKGIYFIKVQDGNKMVNKKLIIQ